MKNPSSKDKTYEETAYYISSLTESAQVFAKIIRGHWKIENQLHWVKDVIFEAPCNEAQRSDNRSCGCKRLQKPTLLAL